MRQLRLGGEPLEAVLLPEAGARLHRLRAFGHDLLRTPANPAEHLRDPFIWGAYVMAPWCNRLPADPTPVGAQVVDLEPNFGDGTAIHGQVAARPWTVDPDGTTSRIRAGRDGWPWAYEVALRPEVADRTLRIRLTLANRSREPMPAGLGLHPWWRRPLALAVDAGSVYPSNVSPPPAPVAAAGQLDLRQAAVPSPGLDATWTGLRSAAVELTWQSLGIGATLSLSRSADHVAVAAPADLDATAVEVQTHAPDGLGRLIRDEPGAMRMLDPGGELELELRVSVQRL
jgi:aldose 1-epimerase